jgi:predicted MPP superfamily phosphohydrolase
LNKWLRRLGALALGCFAYGVLIENRAFKLRRVNVPVLPAGSPDLRVLHISDLHLLRTDKSRLKFISTLAGLEPDLVVSTGDNLAEPEAVESLREALGRLLQIPGVFVFGSSDYEFPRYRNPLSYLLKTSSRDLNAAQMPTERLEQMLASGGWQNLTGQRMTLEVNGLPLEFRGVDDAHLALDDYRLVAGHADKQAAVSIGVTHAPYERVLNAMARDRVKLVFAGHTHGGQVCVPLYGALTTNCDLNPKYAKGLSRLRGGRHSYYLHVSAGLGTSPFAPFRFCCPPEATILTLTARK